MFRFGYEGGCRCGFVGFMGQRNARRLAVGQLEAMQRASTKSLIAQAQPSASEKVLMGLSLGSYVSGPS